MKNKLFLFFITLFLSAGASANNQCDVTANPEIDSLVSDNCEVTDRLKTCAQRVPDPDAMKKRIENLLRFSEEKKEDINRYWKQSYSKTQFAQLFDYNEQHASSDRDYVPTHLLDWFSAGSPDVDREQLKAKMVDNYVKYAQKNDCTPVIKHRYVAHHYPKGFKTENESELKAMMRAPDFEAKKDEYFNEANSKALDSGTYCFKDRANTRGFHYVSQEYPPCSGNVSGLFKDNEWESSTLDEQLQGETTDEVVACIKDRLAKGAAIHHISITSSASALNNSGEAAKRFCKKGFLDLSKARAENARDRILPQLFSMAGHTANDYQSKINMNFSGTNGDGTSGPCPYVIQNDVEVLKSEYQTANGRKALDKEKFVKIHVTFESKTKKVNDSKTYYAASYSCRNIYFDCADPASH